MIWNDQLLWRQLFLNRGWTYDVRAVEFWNSLNARPSVSLVAPTEERRMEVDKSHEMDEGMVMDEDGGSPQPNDASQAILPMSQMEISSSRQSELPDRRNDTISHRASSDALVVPPDSPIRYGLPPSPRHSPAFYASFPASSYFPNPRHLVLPRATQPVLHQPLSRRHSTASQPRTPSPSNTRSDSGTFRRETDTIWPLPHMNSHAAPSTPAEQSVPIPLLSAKTPPPSLDVARVSRVHFDEFGLPYVNWRYLYAARMESERNWKYGEFEMKTFKPNPPIQLESRGIYCCQFDPLRIVVGSRDAMARMYDLETGQLIQTYQYHQKSVLCLQFDDFRYLEKSLEEMDIPMRLVTGSSDSTAAVWDLETGQLLHKLNVGKGFDGPNWTLSTSVTESHGFRPKSRLRWQRSGDIVKGYA